MGQPDTPVRANCEVTRRHFFQSAGAAVAAWSASPLAALTADTDPRLKEAVAKLEYLTGNDKTWNVLDKLKSGAPTLPPDKLRDAGLTPETWFLEVVADTASSSKIDRPLTRARGSALDWTGLMKLAETRAVRFLHLCTCCNGADPFHMDLWEGVPFREIIWMTNAKENIRRVYYQSWHPPEAQGFQSSMALSQALETPPGESPVILAYKRNGQRNSADSKLLPTRSPLEWQPVHRLVTFSIPPANSRLW